MELIKNDKLLSTQKIKPILRRILKTIFCLTTINLFIYINYLMNF